MNPHTKIELYDTNNVLWHTLLNEANSGHTNDILTSDVGSFNFSVPCLGGSDSEFKYTDVAEQWKTKIYLTYEDTFAASDLAFVGKIQKISSPLDTGDGYVKVFEGKSQGEILERRQKRNKRWQAEEVDDIIAEIISDLGLGTDIAVDTTAVTLTARTESYFDLLRKCSDYWASAGVQVKKDFYVNTSDALVWKTRPLRTANVETFSIDDNFGSYRVTRDVLPVKNYITVYGAANSYYPEDRDVWTEDDDTNWTEMTGTLVHNEAVTIKVDTYSVKCIGVGVPPTAIFNLAHDRVTIRDVSDISFWHYNPPLGITANSTIKIYAPDNANYFELQTALAAGASAWHFEQFSLGPSNEYDAVLNPNGTWTVNGNANWWDMQGIEFTYEMNVGDVSTWTDGLYYGPIRCTSTVEDASSQTSYGRRDAEYTDDNLLSDAECEVRANTLLYQLKDPVTRLDWSLPTGTLNLKLGDRIPVTIPQESFVAENFDVVSVMQDWNLEGWVTSASLVDTANSRNLPPVTPQGATLKQMRKLKEISSELYSRVVG